MDRQVFFSYLPPVVIVSLWSGRTDTGSEPQAAAGVQRPGRTTVSQSNAHQLQTLSLTVIRNSLISDQ